MTLADKRKVIEVLLCVAGSGWTIGGAARRIGCGAAVESAAQFAWQDVEGGLYDRYEDDVTEAAYRLIESSPTLRREWFSKP